MDFKSGGEKLVSAEELKSKFKDDWAFLDNTFWKLPEQYELDDLIHEISKNKNA